MENKILQCIDQMQDDIIKDIQQLVSIDSVKKVAKDDAPYGEGIKKALEEALKISQRLGFDTVNIDNHIGYARYGKSQDYLCAIGHLDVVETGVGWKYPPFSATIENGYMYGRGVLDNKGPMIACLYALYALKKLDIQMSHEIRIIFGCDEESGFSDLEYYLTKEKPPLMGFTPDCKYPVVYSERGRAIIQIKAHKNETNRFFQYLNTYFMNAKNTGETLGIDYHDQEYGTLEIRRYHLSSNEDELIFEFVVSYPAGIQLEEIMPQIKKTTDFNVTCIKHYPPVHFDKDSFLIKTLQKAYETMTHEEGTPVTTTGGTYAKRMPNIVPFGPSFPGQKGIGHLPNEWMKIEDIITNAKIYALSFYYLARNEEK